MSKSMIMEVLKRLIKRGEIFSAEVLCDDYNISREVINKMEVKSNV